MDRFPNTVSWYNKHAKEFAKKAGSALYDTMDQFAALLPKNGKILDAGCGSGRDALLFAEKGFDVTGLDISSGLIEEAKRQFPHGKFLVGDMRSLPFPANDFDGVWANASLLHFEKQEDVLQSLKEFHCVLKEHGIVYVSVKLQTGKEKTGMEKDKRFTEPRFFHYFTPDEMHDLLKEAGFSILTSEIVQSRSRPDVQWIQVMGKK